MAYWKLNARFWRWLHCLTHFHRPVTLSTGFVTIYIGCECGYTTFGNRETADAIVNFLKSQKPINESLAPRHAEGTPE